jgi:hypothetical protein
MTTTHTTTDRETAYARLMYGCFRCPHRQMIPLAEPQGGRVAEDSCAHPDEPVSIEVMRERDTNGRVPATCPRRKTEPLTLTIPKIDEGRIQNLLGRLRPVIDVEGGYSGIVPVDPVRIAFTWSPKREGPLLDLAEVGTLKTHHRWGHPALFKPSLAEVYAFVTDELLEQTGATHFRLREDPDAPHLSAPDEHCPDGYHAAIVTLLRGKP